MKFTIFSIINIMFTALLILPIGGFAYNQSYPQNQQGYDQQYVRALPDSAPNTPNTPNKPNTSQPQPQSQMQKPSQQTIQQSQYSAQTPAKNQNSWPTRPQNSMPMQHTYQNQPSPYQSQPQPQLQPQPQPQPQPQSQFQPQQQIQPQFQPQQQQIQPQSQQQPPQPQQQISPTNYQQIWFKNCMNAVTDKKVAPYAKAFCECGWEQISSGSFPLTLLTSQSPADIQKANKLLKVISQTCLVKIMATHNGTS